jgi:hypothetical protein
MESMAVAFPVKPGKAQEWRDRGREFRGARRNEYLAFRRRWGLTVNRLYFQHTPQGDLAVFYLEGMISSARSSTCAQRRTLLPPGSGSIHWTSSRPLMHRAWKMMKRGTAA